MRGLTTATILTLAGCSPTSTAPPPRAISPSGAALAMDAAIAAIDPLTEASIATDMRWLVDPARAGRGSTSPEAIATATWIADELREAGYAPTLQPITNVPGQSNVLAMYEPANTPTGASSVVIVMAHYDHVGKIGDRVYPGADDNASGVAVALAVARDLRAKRDVTARVLFLFTGAEEIGLFGAKAFVAAPTVPLDQIRAVYNLDMVGRNFFESVANKPFTIAAVGFEKDPEAAAAAMEAAKLAELELLQFPSFMVSAIGQQSRSDDWVFRDKGIFAVHFSTGLNDDYHQPSDTLDKIKLPQLVRVAILVRAMVSRTADTQSGTRTPQPPP